MGYYTNYSGSVVSGPASEKEVALAIANLDYWDCSDDPDIETIDDVINYDEHKWYNWEADMREVSEQFPDTLIEICGEGEENGDLWKAYFMGGKSTICKAEIVYPDFHLEDLK